MGSRSRRRRGLDFRMETCSSLLALHPAVVRGNASEILASPPAQSPPPPRSKVWTVNTTRGMP